MTSCQPVIDPDQQLLFQGSIPVNGSVPNEPSLAMPMESLTVPYQCVLFYALHPVGIHCARCRGEGAEKVSVESLHLSTRQPSSFASTCAITFSLPCW